MTAPGATDIQPKFLPDALLAEIRQKFLHVDFCPVTKRPRIFLESGGGSLKLKAAIEATTLLAGIPDQEARDNDASRFVTAAINTGRADLRTFLGASDGQVISGESGTMLLWRIVRDVALTQAAGPFLSSTLEHPATHDPAGYWAERTGRVRNDIHLNIKTGTVTPEDYAKAVTPDTRLATIIHTSQLTGLHVDLHGIIRAIRAVSPDCFIIVDGIQNAPHGRVEVDTYGADAYVFSAYKVFSRLSHGFAWLSPRLTAIPHEKPYGKKDYVWEQGSRDPGIYASHTAVIDYFDWVGSHFTTSVDRRARVLAAADAMAAHEKALVGLLIHGDAQTPGLLAHPGVTLIGPPDLANRQGIVSFGLKGFTAPELVRKYAEHDIRVHARIDDEYSGHILADLGMKDCLRVSLCHYNTAAEIRAALVALRKISPA